MPRGIRRKENDPVFPFSFKIVGWSRLMIHRVGVVLHFRKVVEAVPIGVH